MRITKSQLRRIIAESILKEDSYDQIYQAIDGRESGLLEPDSSNPEAIQIHMAGTEYGRGKDTKAVKVRGMEKNAMEAISKAVGKDLSKKDYYIWRGLSEYWDSGMTKLPASGRRGDPYLYMPSSIGKDGFIDKVRVVAGPQAKAIGRAISASALQGKTANLKDMPKDFLEAVGERLAGFVKDAYDAGVDMSDGVEEFGVRMVKKFFDVEDSTARTFVKVSMIGAMTALGGLPGLVISTAIVAPDNDKETA